MPERLRFDLRQERWIPCERPDGSRELVGIERALVEAHTFAAIHDESPLVTAALHRLLLAILQRVFAPRTMDEWIALYEARAFDAAKIRAYLDEWAERFDLFHPERPFLQVRGLAKVLLDERGKEPEPTSARRFAIETSSYSGAVNLFDPLPSEAALRPDEAARSLLGYLGYTPGGRIQNEATSWDGGRLRPGAIALVRGDTLAETLVFNLLVHARRAADDLPPWERASIERRVRASRGPVDLLVWPSRRVELLAERDGGGAIAVRHVLTAAGERLEGDAPDPMFTFVTRDPKKPPFAVRIDPDRALFRDSAALFEAVAPAQHFHSRPAACTQLAEAIAEGAVPRSARFQVELLGLASNQAAIDLWRAERLPLPGSLLTDGARLGTLRAALGLTEELARQLDFRVLGTLAENAIAPGERTAHKEDIGNLKRALGGMAAYWSALGRAFPAWLDALGSADPDAHLAPWKAILRKTAHDVLSEAERRLGTNARALQAGAKARGALSFVLGSVLGPAGRSQIDSPTAERSTAPDTAIEGAPT